MLQVAEIFYSIQGEATYTGTPAIFIRLAGCNLSCSFCDTDYSLKFIASIDDIIYRVRAESATCPMVILTGGEPTLQRDSVGLIEALRSDGRRVHVESNGTTPIPLQPDVWLTISPKERLHPYMAARANEIKLIVNGRVPTEWIPAFPATTPIFLQPEGNKKSNIDIAIAAAKAGSSRFRVSLQTHKFIGVR